jgi:hypothetical protein
MTSEATEALRGQKTCQVSFLLLQLLLLGCLPLQANGLLWLKQRSTEYLDDCHLACGEVGTAEGDLGRPMVAINGGKEGQALCAVDSSLTRTPYAGTQFGDRAANDNSSLPLPCTYYEAGAVKQRSFAERYWCGCALQDVAARYAWRSTAAACADAGFTHHMATLCRASATTANAFAMGQLLNTTTSSSSSSSSSSGDAGADRRGGRKLLQHLALDAVQVVSVPGRDIKSDVHFRIASVSLLSGDEPTEKGSAAATAVTAAAAATGSQLQCMTAAGPVQAPDFDFLCFRHLQPCSQLPSNPPHPNEEPAEWDTWCDGTLDTDMCYGTCTNGDMVAAICDNGTWGNVFGHCPVSSGKP